jgi:hypothetical protein
MFSQKHVGFEGLSLIKIKAYFERQANFGNSPYFGPLGK